jgi:hypothetical protein
VRKADDSAGCVLSFSGGWLYSTTC